jgi:hypothetical protein
MLTAACGVAAFAAEGALSAGSAARAVAHATAGCMSTLLLITLHHDARAHTERFLPSWTDVLPLRLRPARDALLARLAAVVAALPPPPLDYRVMAGLNVLGNTLARTLAPGGAPGSSPAIHAFGTMGDNGRIVLRIYLTLSLVAVASGWLAGGNLAQLGGLAKRMGLDGDAALAEKVRALVAAAPTEADALAAASVALRAGLFPRAAGIELRCADASDAEDGEEEDNGDDDDDDAAASAISSRAFVAAQAACTIADSRDFPGGLATFSDWRRCAAAGATLLIAAPLPAGPAKLGTLLARFNGGGDAAPRAGYEAALVRCCRAIGEALFARRELATAHAATQVAGDIFPAHVVERLLARSRRASVSVAASARRSQDAAAAVAPAGALRLDVSSPRLGMSSPRRSRGVSASNDPAADVLRSARLSAHAGSPTAATAEEEEAGLFFCDSHACITVIFIDVVNFTPLAESQPPAATMRMLHSLFSRFDALCESLGIYKGAPLSRGSQRLRRATYVRRH